MKSCSFRRDVGRQREFAERLRRARRLGDADPVSQVRQCGDVILQGRPLELAGCPALDPGQDDVGGGDQVGLQAFLE